jgi:histidinol-phosphate/aromatic aminotransferase/cobyric acid decarboxylase-like protein
MAAGVAITRLGFVASIPALQMNLDSVLAMFIYEQVRSYSAFSAVNLQKSHIQYRAKARKEPEYLRNGWSAGPEYGHDQACREGPNVQT